MYAPHLSGFGVLVSAASGAGRQYLQMFGDRGVSLHPTPHPGRRSRELVRGVAGDGRRPTVSRSWGSSAWAGTSPPRAIVKEHRLAARIANGGAFELGSTKPPRMSAEDRGCLFSDPAGFDTATGPILAANPSLRRASTHSMWGVPVQTASPARWLQMTEAYTLERGAPIASRARPSSSTASTSTHSPARPASSTTHSDVKRRSCISPARTEQVSTARSPRACSRSSVSSTGWTGCLRCDPETASRRTADHLPIYRQPCNLSLHGT